MSVFVFKAPQIIMTGSGSIAQIGIEAKKLGATKVLIITDKVINQTGLINKITAPLEQEGLEYGIIDEVIPEPPFENLEQMAAQIQGKGFDLFIGVGGGSALDVTKVLAIMMTNKGDVRDLVGIEKVEEPGVPFILAPTTAGTGSEVTFNAIFLDTRDMVKKGIVSKYLLPQVAIVDAELTLTAPASVTAASGMDALVHAVEGYTSVNATEVSDSLALHSIKLISQSLRTAVYNGNELKAREDMAMGSLLAGMSFANAGVGAVHALAYPLGGKFHVPHGVSNALLLPYVMRFNVIANLTKFSEIAKAMGENVDGLSLREAADKAVKALAKLAQDVGIPRSLKDVGVTEADIHEMAVNASGISRLLGNNPRRLTLNDIEQIYRDAYEAIEI